MSQLRLVHVNEALEDPSKADGVVATQAFASPTTHELGTYFPGANIAPERLRLLGSELKALFTERNGSVRFNFDADDDLVIWVSVPATVREEELKSYAVEFREVLRRLGFLIRPMMCHIRAPRPKLH